MVQHVAGQTSETDAAPTLSIKERRSLCPLEGLQPSLNLHDTKLCLLNTCKSTVRTVQILDACATTWRHVVSQFHAEWFMGS